MTQNLSDYMGKTEDEHNIGGGSGGGWYSFDITDQESKKGTHRVRILTFPETLPQHYDRGGYMGVCLGKANNCPGCKKDAETKKKKEEDAEKYKDLRYTKSVKHLVWVIDYRTLKANEEKTDNFEDVCKLAPLPHSVLKKINAWQEDVAMEDYQFDSFPMPYDVIIIRDDSGQITQYEVTAARQNTPIPDEVEAQLSELTPPAEVIQKMREKKIKELGHDEIAQQEYDDFDNDPEPEDLPM